MNFFEQELRKLFEDSETLTDPRFAGRICVARLTDTTNVKLRFTTLGYHEKYEGIEAAVLSRSEGIIDKTVFRFSDILGRKSIPSNPNFSDGLVPHVWKGHRDYEWYVYRPTPRDYEQIAETAESYLEIFQEPVQNQGMSRQMR